MGSFPTGPRGNWLASDPVLVEHAKAGSLTAKLRMSLDGLSRSERKTYSIARAIAGLAGEQTDYALEREVSDSIAAHLGTQPRGGGLFVPTQLRPQGSAASINTLTDGAGKYTVGTEVRDLIELLRARTRVIQLGATFFGGLSANVSFPRHLSGTTGSWVAEAPESDVGQVDSVFGNLPLTPKTYMSTTAYSRQLLAQSSVDIENFVRGDIALYHAQALDAAAISGTGANYNMPLGILNTGSIGDVAMGANGAVPTYSKIVDLETNVSTANADEAGMKYLTTPGVRGLLRVTKALDASVSSIPVWENGPTPGSGLLNGYPAYVSTQVPSTLTKGATSGSCHAIIFGYWPSVLIGEWGILTILVDPFTAKKKNLVEVTSFQMVDVGLRHVAQMAAIQDAKLS